jgi:hypothetical protein
MGLKRALRIARDLTEPGEVNNEYVRGQMNLICDLYGLLGQDGDGEIVTAVIAHQMSVKAGIKLLQVRCDHG